jgi:hypothetical protein
LQVVKQQVVKQHMGEQPAAAPLLSRACWQKQQQAQLYTMQSKSSMF